MEDNILKWERIYAEGKAGSFLTYPSENLVRLFHRIRPELPSDIRCLDYGFGSGNNSEFLITKVSELFGIEVSETSLQLTSERLSTYEQFRRENFSLVQDSEQPCLRERIDLLVAWQVLYYNTEGRLLETIELLSSYIRPGGVIIATLATTRDVSAHCSIPLGGSEYRIDDTIPSQEGCVVTIPESKNRLYDYFGCFEVIDSGYFETISFNNSKNRSSHYYYVGRKKPQ